VANQKLCYKTSDHSDVML